MTTRQAGYGIQPNSALEGFVGGHLRSETETTESPSLRSRSATSRASLAWYTPRLMSPATVAAVQAYRGIVTPSR